MNKNTSTTEVEIVDPVWIRSVKNDPAAYKKNTSMNMDIVIYCDRFPKHDFTYWFCGNSNDGNNLYFTEVVESHMFGGRDTIFGVEPRDAPFPNNVALIESLDSYWWVNKAYFSNPTNFDLAGMSNHKIYITYDAPLFTVVNVLALEYACAYADGLNDTIEIAEYIVGGAYSEGWDYDLKHVIFPDPLNVIREEIGQCADYANLLTYYYKAIGLQANSVIIFNGKTIGTKKFLLIWENTEIPPPANWTCLYSESLTSCNDVTKKWSFKYHSASYFQGFICDAVLGEFREHDDYSGYWKYYLHPKPTRFSPPHHPPSYFSHGEPPPFEPSYYHWDEFIPTNNILPGVLEFNSNFVHP